MEKTCADFYYYIQHVWNSYGMAMKASKLLPISALCHGRQVPVLDHKCF